MNSSVTYLFFVEVGCYSNCTLNEDSNSKQTAVKKNHLVALSRYSTASEDSDEDDDWAGYDDDAPRDMVHTGGEETEELTSVYDGPQSHTETCEAEHE